MRWPTLIQACDDPQLFLPAFPPGQGLQPKQRDLLSALEAPDGARVHVWALGRRSGKSTVAALKALHVCLMRPDLDTRMRPGETRFVVVVATNLLQARLIVDAARSVVERSPLLARLLVGGNADELRFETAEGATTCLRAMPCSSRSTRGFPVSTLILDEAAHFQSDTDGPATAEKVWEALVPATAQFGSAARIIVASTPYGTDGLFARLFHQARSGELTSAAAFQHASREVNPALVTQELLDAERIRDPESFAQEYEADFLTPGDAYLDFARIEVPDRGELRPADVLPPLVAGLDPSFSVDPFGLAIIGRDRLEPRRLVLARALAYEGRGRTFEGTLAAVSAECARYGVRRCITDQHSAAAVVDRLKGDGIHVQVLPMTAASKTAAFGELRARLYDGSLELYRDQRLLGELRRLRTRFTPGQSSVFIPRAGGSHGDVAHALALAVFDQRHMWAPGGKARGGGKWHTAGVRTGLL